MKLVRSKLSSSIKGEINRPAHYGNSDTLGACFRGRPRFPRRFAGCNDGATGRLGEVVEDSKFSSELCLGCSILCRKVFTRSRAPLAPPGLPLTWSGCWLQGSLGAES